MFYKVYVICISLVLSSCQYGLDRYTITPDGIYSKSGPIREFSITQYPIDHDGMEDIRPLSHFEVMRYCCELRPNRSPSKRVFFSSNDGRTYRWSLCKLDISIIANDSLNNLPFEEKLKYADRKKADRSTIDQSVNLPFNIEQGYVYQIFGLKDLDGSYYFRLDSNNRLIVQFFDRGPW